MRLTELRIRCGDPASMCGVMLEAGDDISESGLRVRSAPSKIEGAKELRLVDGVSEALEADLERGKYSECDQSV